MKLSAEQVQSNYELHLKIIDRYISGDRKQKILDMIEKIGEEYLLAPASGKNWYHGAYPGGYLVHVNNVVRLALQEMRLYEKSGGYIDFTEEELVFAALFHDLGKIGDGEKANYLPNESDWHRINQGLEYKNNPNLDFMLIPDRSLYLLQKHGITLSQKEYIAIKIHDGLWDEANKAYFISYSPDSRLKTNMCYILHSADMLAARLEYDIEHHKKDDN